MTTWLSHHSSNVYSQFGEDGCIKHIFDTIEMTSRVCVEFGAGDGTTCSNTAKLWRDEGWHGVLVEPDPKRFEDLEGNAAPFKTTCVRSFVTPTGPDSISQILEDHEIEYVDYMSIDVDGDDYYILQGLECRPRVLSIEFNPTVPPHISLYQTKPGEMFGASLLALMILAAEKEYQFVGATYCNAFFVKADEAVAFDAYERNPEVLCKFSDYAYAVTDFSGRLVLAGKPLPWGTRAPYVLPLEATSYVTPATDSPQQIRRGFEAEWGPARWMTLDGVTPERMVEILEKRPRLVCVDLTNIGDLDTVSWVWEAAKSQFYTQLLVGRVLGLIAPGES